MPDDDDLTAAREKVLDWGPDLRRPSAMVRFRQDVAELERLAAEWAVWNAATERVTIGYSPAYPDSGEAIVARDSDGRVWTPEEVGEALGAVAAAATKPWDRPIRPLPVPGHSGPLQSNGPDDPWTCNACGWTEGEPPREHEEERAT